MLTDNRPLGSPLLHTAPCFCEMPISGHPCALAVTVCNFYFPPLFRSHLRKNASSRRLFRAFFIKEEENNLRSDRSFVGRGLAPAGYIARLRSLLGVSLPPPYKINRHISNTGDRWSPVLLIISVAQGCKA